MGGQQQMQPLGGQMGGQQQAFPMGAPNLGGQVQMPTLGQNFMQQNQHPGGFLNGPLGKFAPMFGMAGMMAGHGGLGQMAPLLGGLAGWGLHKAGAF
jgi:hypothetical protein